MFSATPMKFLAFLLCFPKMWIESNPLSDGKEITKNYLKSLTSSYAFFELLVAGTLFLAETHLSLEKKFKKLNEKRYP